MNRQPGIAARSTEINREVILNDDGRCPLCRNEILVDEGEKQLLKGRISIVENGKLKTKCKLCKTYVIVPFRMLKGLQMPVKIGDKVYKMSMVRELTP